MKTNGSESAFPHVAQVYQPHGGQRVELPPGRGISKREYYASSAPAIPDWYQYTSATPMPQMPRCTLALGDREQFESLRVGSIDKSNVSLEVLSFHDEYKKAEQARRTWQNQTEAARFFAWRWFYADQMVAGAEVQS